MRSDTAAVAALVGEGGGLIGTGFAVAGGVLVTCAHCFGDSPFFWCVS